MQAPDGANRLDSVAEAVDIPRPVVLQQAPTTEHVLAHPAEVNAPSHETEVLKVSARSRPSAVAGAIAGVMRERGTVGVQSIGAGATNQAIKAVAIAHAYLWDEGVKLCCVPSFITVTIDGDLRTGIQLLVQQRPG